MKKITFFFLILLFAGILHAQQNNVLVELFTGTWCGFCPCCDAAADQVLTAHPNTLVLAYHEGSSDPFYNFNGNNIIGLFGITGYPTGIMGRRSGLVIGAVIAPTWVTIVDSQMTYCPSPISLSFSGTSDSIARTVTLTVTAHALRDIDTNVNVNFVITEDNIVYPQDFYSMCGTEGYHNDYIHKWVVRNMVNGATGEALSTGHWASGTTKTKTWTTNINTTWVWYNCNATAFAYFSNGTLSPSNSYVLNTKKMKVKDVITGIESQSGYIPTNYSLSQNYPNPFNPTTSIHFSMPNDGNVSLKVYDVLGNEVMVCYNGFIKAGVYNVEFNGSSLTSGIYFYKLTAGSFNETRKMMLIK